MSESEVQLLAIEIEISVLLQTFVEDMPKWRRRKLRKRLKRNAKAHAKDRRKIGGDAAAAADIALSRLLAHVAGLKSLKD